MDKTDFHSDYKNCKADICKVSRIIRIKIRSLIAVMMHSVNPQMSNVYGSIKSCRKTSQTTCRNTMLSHDKSYNDHRSLT